TRGERVPDATGGRVWFPNKNPNHRRSGMKPREVQSYDALAEEIWKSAQALLGFNFVAQRQWYEQTFCLAALGDSLA
ncbi:hypothetical protein PSYMO_34594, partial [Pseudomonas amygdali pv. mori str. 301020]